MSDTQFFQNELIPVAAMDGPSGAGKSTVAKGLAELLGFHYLDSGAIYRTIALRVMTQAGRPDPSDELVTDIAKILIVQMSVNARGEVCINDEPMGDEIRTEQVSQFTPKISQIPELRIAVKQFQLDMRKSPGLVPEGRDMCQIFEGPRVLRLYIDASPEARASRRMNDPRANKDGNLVHEEVLAAIIARDNADIERNHGKLKIHPEAQVVDTSKMVAGQALGYVYDLYKKWEKDLLHVA